MNEISRSPNRHRFQREAYIRRCQEQGVEPREDYLKVMDTVAENHLSRFGDNPPENNLEYDLLTTPWILEKARASPIYAQNIYAALCNQDWQRAEVMPILKDEIWNCSWRYAGGLVADMLGEGDYIDWYCSCIRREDGSDQDRYVSEGTVTEEIQEDFKKLGWQPVNDRDD